MSLTGRENLVVGGALLGYSREFIRSRLDDIADFAAIGDVLDTPLKHYSTGMRARLGFALATQVPADILAVDEVLSVGDQRFQERCLQRIRRSVDEGMTLLFVSHDLGTVEKLCDRAIQLRRGAIIDEGPASEVIERYLEFTPSRFDRRTDAAIVFHGLSMQQEHIPSTDRGVFDLDVEVASSVEDVEIVTEIAHVSTDPNTPIARSRAPVPSDATNPGHYTLSGVTPPLIWESSAHIRVKLLAVNTVASDGARPVAGGLLGGGHAQSRRPPGVATRAVGARGGRPPIVADHRKPLGASRGG